MLPPGPPTDDDVLDELCRVEELVESLRPEDVLALSAAAPDRLP